MSDLEKFIELYKSVGVNLEVQPGDERFGEQALILEVPEHSEQEKDDQLICGYVGFKTHIFFDNEGNFREQRIWE